MNNSARWTLALIAVVLVFIAWADDFVTLQGEHTIYTVTCEDGTWQGTLCTGRLRAGDRYRFRALKQRREVLFCRVGVDEPSGKFTHCDIKDGRNWNCTANADAARTITLALARGRAQREANGATLPFHAISKWKWWCLRLGVGAFRRASY